MQKAIEALQIELSATTWQSRMEELVNILDSYDWQSRGNTITVGLLRGMIQVMLG